LVQADCTTTANWVDWQPRGIWPVEDNCAHKNHTRCTVFPGSERENQLAQLYLVHPDRPIGHTLPGRY